MKRIIRNAYRIGALLALGATLSQGWGFGLSVLIGTVLAALNFAWLKGGVDRALVGGKGLGAEVAAKYLFRLLLISITVFAMIRIPFLSLVGALLGLSVFVLSGMLEALILLWEQPGSQR